MRSLIGVALVASALVVAGAAAISPVTAAPQAKLLWAHNTLDLVEVECGEAYLPQARERANLEVLTEPRPLPLDKHGNLPDSVKAWR